MNYYDELLRNIDELVKSKEFSKAKSLIDDELKVAYIPKDVEDRLHEYMDIVKENKPSFSLSDEDIEGYLHGDGNHQLIAVNELDKRNLRDYSNLINEYLCSDGFLNAKVLLVDSLIRQEIGFEVNMTDSGMEYSFIPKYLLPVEQSDGYLEGKGIIEDEFMKNPSMLELAKELLFKETIMKLPINLDRDEGRLVAYDIIRYIYGSFGDRDSLNKFNECH